jgi:hypothetical protein
MEKTTQPIPQEGCGSLKVPLPSMSAEATFSLSRSRHDPIPELFPTTCSPRQVALFSIAFGSPHAGGFSHDIRFLTNANRRSEIESARRPATIFQANNV